jgi:small-conductance mechanosensitive channel
MLRLPGGVLAQTATGTDAAPVTQTANATGPDGIASSGVLAGLLPDWIPDVAIELTASLLVFVLAYLVSRLVVRLFGRRLARRFDRPSLTRTAISGIRALVFVAAALVVLRINGLDLGNIALSITVLSAVLGVILAPIVGSVISGVFLLADQPYEIGDMIQLDEAGKRGYVEDITLRYTKIFTLDNTFLVIPNGTIRDRDVYNFSAEDPRTRLSLPILVTYESDVPQAQRRIEEAARRVEGVIEGGPSIRIGASRYPAAPRCLIESFADHGVSLSLRFWVKKPYRIPAVRSTVQENIYEAFADDAALEFAYPHSHLVFDETSGALSVDDARPRPGSGGRARSAGTRDSRIRRSARREPVPDRPASEDDDPADR